MDTQIGHNQAVKETSLFYAGFDPSSDGLHIGSLSILANLRRRHEEGHLVVAIIGWATGQIGDPTGKNEMRPTMSRDKMNANIEGIRRDIQAVCPGAKIILNDWFPSAIDMMNDVFRHIPMSRLLSLSSVKDRLENGNGITLMEALYPVMQGFDFVQMSDIAKKNNINRVVQVGGEDQTGNMMTGLHLLGRMREDREGFISTIPLITTASGVKMGKTAGNALWLSPYKLDDNTFFDNLISMPDDVFAKMANIILEDMKGLPAPEDSFIQFKHAVAQRIFSLARGRQRLSTLLETKDGGSHDALPKVTAEANLALTFKNIGFASSMSEVMRLADGGGVRVNDRKITKEELREIKVQPGDLISIGKRKAIIS